MSYREDSEKFSSMMAFGALMGIVVVIVLVIIFK
jgi:hypothetical protein